MEGSQSILQFLPGRIETSLFVDVFAVLRQVLANIRNEFLNSTAQIWRRKRIGLCELAIDAMGKDPHRLDFELKFTSRNDVGFANVTFDDRKVVGERNASHKHEIFLIDVRTFAKFRISLRQVEPAEISPCPIRIETIAGWIEVVLRRKSLVRCHLKPFDMRVVT